MYSAQTKLNMWLFAIIFVFIGGNCYMNIVEIEAIQKQLDTQDQFMCQQTGKITSKHNIILSCNKVK